jgi:metallophosphoesterase (TIGR00282 family)
MKILFIGDIIGSPGRSAVRHIMPEIAREHGVHFVIANGENAAAGFGLTVTVAKELFALGIDVLTTGNHLWDKKEIIPFLSSEKRILRPANYSDQAVGFPYGVYKAGNGAKVGVLNLLGRVFCSTTDCPFKAADKALMEIKKETDIVIVDIHAEATSEKIAMGWYLDGRVSAVIGTHTHVMTADERVLPLGTAYITDAGMCGGFDSVIGMDKEGIIKRFLDQMPAKFKPAEGDVRFNGVVVEVEEKNGKAKTINVIKECL